MKYNGREALLVEMRGFKISDAEFDFDQLYIEITDKAGTFVEGIISRDDSEDHAGRLYLWLHSKGVKYSPGYRHRVFGEDFEFTRQGVLDFVNAIADRKYEKIVQVYRIPRRIERTLNFTPEALIYEFAKDHGLKYACNSRGARVLETPYGKYKYMCLNTKASEYDDLTTVNIILEDIRGEGLRYQ